MIITEMEHFQSVCKKKLVEWYNKMVMRIHRQYLRLIYQMCLWYGPVKHCRIINAWCPLQ